MAKSFLFTLAFLVLAQLAAAQKQIDVFRWVVPYRGPQEYQASVGDTMIFRWAQGFHNVYIHPTMNCTLDGRIEVGAQPGTTYIFNEADGSPEGTDMFFSCDIGDGAHCRAGQFLTVKVFSGAAPGGSGATISPTSSGTNSPIEVDIGEEVVEETSMDNITDVTEPDEELMTNMTEPEDLEDVTAPEEPDTVETPATDGSAAVEQGSEASDTEADSAMAESGGRLNSFAFVLGVLSAGLAIVLT